jgi:Ca2+-binding EF-hand superfamily protein
MSNKANTCSFSFIFQVIAHKSSTDEILELRKVFDQYDSANNGIISYDEFMAALHEKNYPEEKVKQIFDSMVSGPRSRCTISELILHANSDL